MCHKPKKYIHGRQETMSDLQINYKEGKQDSFLTRWGKYANTGMTANGLKCQGEARRKRKQLKKSAVHEKLFALLSKIWNHLLKCIFYNSSQREPPLCCRRCCCCSSRWYHFVWLCFYNTVGCYGNLTVQDKKSMRPFPGCYMTFSRMWNISQCTAGNTVAAYCSGCFVFSLQHFHLQNDWG